MSTREWLETDYYAELGVARSDSTETITERYRARAWELHPDRNPGDAEAEAEFKRLARAYAILGNEQRRAAYDATRDRVFDRGYAPSPGSTRPTQTPTRSVRLFRFNPRVGLVVGVALLLLGGLASWWIVDLTGRDARVRSDGVATTAQIVQVAPTPVVEFQTADRGTVRAPAPVVRNRRNGGYVLGEAVKIRYLREQPSQLVVDESQVARNVTMWIIAMKLLVCGVIVVAISMVRLRRDPAMLAEKPK